MYIYQPYIIPFFISLFYIQLNCFAKYILKEMSPLPGLRFLGMFF